MSSIRRALRIDPDTVRTVRDHLERHVAPHLAPDVSNYARGRQRAWLQVEAPLGPTQPWRPGLASHRLWPWLAAVWRGIDPDTEPLVGLAVHGSTGIAWHRDASYAHARATPPTAVRSIPSRCGSPAAKSSTSTASTSTASSTPIPRAGPSCSGA